MLKIKLNLIAPIIILSVICGIFGLIENNENVSKYSKNEYINFFKISNQILISKNEEKGNFISKFFNFIKKDILRFSITSNTNINLSFRKSLKFNRMIINTNSNVECNEILDKNKIKLMIKKEENSPFTLIEDFNINSNKEKVIIHFNEPIKATEMQLEGNEKCFNNMKEEDIALLNPETGFINEKIINAFDQKDYRLLTLSEDFNKKEVIDNILEELPKYEYSNFAKNFIQRINSVFNGEISYEPRREFTTNPKLAYNIIHQRGNIDSYARNTLKMANAGTNRQSTGIYGRSNETITIHVQKGNKKDPLPSIRFTQYIGHWRNWLGKVNNLKEGTQSFIFDNFKITDDYTLKTFPGGPIYLINPYTDKEQSQNISIYIEGGELFPTFNLDGDEEEYKNNLLECIKLNQKDENYYFDITELVGLRTIFTIKASEAYKKYVEEKNSPKLNLLGWDEYIKKLFIYDGVQFEENEPFYNISNNYVNLHIRYAQPYGAAYAYSEHIGIFNDDWIDRALNFVEKDIGWGFPHEIGHMMDNRERTVSETSNNMFAKYSETYLQRDGTWGPDRQENKIKYLTPDNVDHILRGCQSEEKAQCKGFLTNIELNYLVFWDLESMYHGYWGKVDNMYRYNNTSLNKLSKEEKFVYFSNVVLGLDLGYYFSRWGLSFSKGNNIFNESKTTSEYKDLMKKAINNNLIDTKTKKKYWYLDYKEYNYLNKSGLGCYKDKDEYDIQIIEIKNPSLNEYVLSLPKVKCPDHLGFEIYENEQIIGFTYDYTYSDKNEYESGYIPKYKIIAYDRLLDTSKESEYKSFKSSSALRQINNKNVLYDE